MPPMISQRKGGGGGGGQSDFHTMWLQFDRNNSGSLEIAQLQNFLSTINNDNPVPQADAQFVMYCAGNVHSCITPKELAAAVNVWSLICRDAGVWIDATFDK